MPDPGPLGQMLLDERCYATTALAIAASRFGLDFLQWEPTTLTLEMEKEFGIELPEHTYNRLNAAVLLVNTNFYYKKLDHFIVINNVLYNGDLDDGVLTPEEICWGITEAQLIWPQKIPNSPYELLAPEIVDLIRFTFNYYSILFSPEALKLVGIFFDNLNPVLEEFNDDPMMYNLIYQNAIAKVRALNVLVLNKLSELIYQLNRCGIPATFERIAQLMLPPG